MNGMIFSGVLASRSAAMPEYVNRTVKVIGCFYGCATMKWSALAKRHHADYVPRGDAEVESCPRARASLFWKQKSDWSPTASGAVRQILLVELILWS